MSQSDLLKQIRLFYTRVLSRAPARGIVPGASFNMYTGLVKYLWERYELRDLAAQRCGSVLRSAAEYMGQDERINRFALLVGIKAAPCGEEAALIYLRLLQTLETPLERLFGPECAQELAFEAGYRKMFKYWPGFRRVVGSQ